jgi:purine nucleoside phosphorylase
MRLLGVEHIIVTNAAGGLNAAFNVGVLLAPLCHFLVSL